MGWPAIFSVIFAHQGGWDEFLMVAAPIAVFAFLLRAANRRASRLDDDDGSVFKAPSDEESPAGRSPKGLI